MRGERVKLAVGILLLAAGVVSGIWFTERLRQYPGPPLEVALGALENETEDAALDGVLELALDDGRFVVADDAAYALTGRIQAERGGYRVDVEVVELPAGSVLASARGTVSTKDALPGALERISAELRRELARGGI